ncbi:hypothetical protein [Coxiella-like endosymbiont]|uniref:hypothetical protein n=1 Tax=Coxiella-like endosymbiont TaxID=1592897 RepID=UPI00272BA862|nr:hypothetical protein [Coxiella-like endosymbiont]
MRDLYISYEDRKNIPEILDNQSNPLIDLIVVSDSKVVLGIGDQWDKCYIQQKNAK